MNSIRYEDFKDTDKYNLEVDSNGKLKFLKKKIVVLSEIESVNNALKVPLTKIDRKEGDVLLVTNPDSEIKKIQFDFKYFNYKEKKWYFISISYKKPAKKIWERFSWNGDLNERYWEISVWEIDKEGRKVCKAPCMVTVKNSAESLEIEKLFSLNSEISEKIVSLINKHKYNNVILKKHENNSLYKEVEMNVTI